MHLTSNMLKSNIHITNDALTTRQLFRKTF
nr:MAG TPA_asm: hypothetical protein [Caudoviricetes sp.]